MSMLSNGHWLAQNYSSDNLKLKPKLKMDVTEVRNSMYKLHLKKNQKKKQPNDSFSTSHVFQHNAIFIFDFPFKNEHTSTHVMQNDWPLLWICFPQNPR